MASPKKELIVPHLDLYNFEESWAKDTDYVLTSPRSLEACSRCGIQPVQLLFKSLPEIEKEFTERELPYTDLYDIYQRGEKERQELLKRTREERERMMWTIAEAEATPVSDTSEESVVSYSSRLSNSALRSNTKRHSKTTRDTQAFLSSASSLSGTGGDEAEKPTSAAAQCTTPKVRFDPAPAVPFLAASGVPSKATASSKLGSSSRPTLLEKRKLEMVGQKLDLHARPKTPQGRSASPAARPPTPTATTTAGIGSPPTSPKAQRRARHATAPAAQLDGARSRRAGGGQEHLSASASFTSSARPGTSTATNGTERAWSSADGALLSTATKTRSRSATNDATVAGGGGSSLWSPEELSVAVVGVGMSAMDARKMRLLSERDRRILQKMVERRHAESARQSTGQTAELQWQQQREHRRTEKQLEEQEHRRAIDRKREQERAAVEVRRIALDGQQRDEVDALQQEIAAKETRWSQLYDAQQRRAQRAAQDNAAKEDRRRAGQELRRAEILIEDAEQRRAMLDLKEARIETAAETRERLEHEELERVRARNAAERANIAGRLQELEADEAQEQLALQAEVREKHERAERRLERMAADAALAARARTERRDRQAERNREAALQLDHDGEQLRQALGEELRLKEEAAGEAAERRVADRRARTADDLAVRRAAHARKMEDIRRAEAADERAQRRQLADKELRIEAMAREREDGVRESRDRAREAEVLREKLKEACMAGTFDRKVQSAELAAPMFSVVAGGRARSANQSSSTKMLIG